MGKWREALVPACRTAAYRYDVIFHRWPTQVCREQNDGQLVTARAHNRTRDQTSWGTNRGQSGLRPSSAPWCQVPLVVRSLSQAGQAWRTLLFSLLLAVLLEQTSRLVLPERWLSYIFWKAQRVWSVCQNLFWGKAPQIMMRSPNCLLGWKNDLVTMVRLAGSGNGGEEALFTGAAVAWVLDVVLYQHGPLLNDKPATLDTFTKSIFSVRQVNSEWTWETPGLVQQNGLAQTIDCRYCANHLLAQSYWIVQNCLC